MIPVCLPRRAPVEVAATGQDSGSALMGMSAGPLSHVQPRTLTKPLSHAQMGMVGRTLACQYCGVTIHDPALVRRATSGRPYQRMVARLKREGTHVCWICGERIDMALPVTHKWAWTLDHVQPKALYPCIGLESWNHREAHRTCNSSKGKGTIVRRQGHTQDW